jgi:hypothetical protein
MEILFNNDSLIIARLFLGGSEGNLISYRNEVDVYEKSDVISIGENLHADVYELETSEVKMLCRVINKRLTKFMKEYLDYDLSPEEAFILNKSFTVNVDDDSKGQLVHYSNNKFGIILGLDRFGNKFTGGELGFSAFDLVHELDRGDLIVYKREFAPTINKIYGQMAIMMSK